jgi:hypothetical protein
MVRNYKNYLIYCYISSKDVFFSLSSHAYETIGHVIINEVSYGFSWSYQINLRSGFIILNICSTYDTENLNEKIRGWRGKTRKVLLVMYWCGIAA